MPDYVTIPNQPGSQGSPTNAQIAADDVSGTGSGPFIQQVSLANISASLRLLLQELSILGLAQDASTGRLRVLLDAATATATVTTSTLGATIAGFGPSTGQVTAASYMPWDLMTMAWADSVRRNIT